MVLPSCSAILDFTCMGFWIPTCDWYTSAIYVYYMLSSQFEADQYHLFFLFLSARLSTVMTKKETDSHWSSTSASKLAQGRLKQFWAGTVELRRRAHLATLLYTLATTRSLYFSTQRFPYP